MFPIQNIVGLMQFIKSQFIYLAHFKVTKADRYQELCHFQLERGQGDAPIWRCTQEPLKLLSNAFISLRDQSSSFSANREML